MEKEIFLTAEGIRAIEADIEFLKTVERPKNSEKIKLAIEFGDISENAEYENAKNEQAFIEGKIMELEKKLRNARLIEKSEQSELITLGAKILLRDVEFKEDVEYILVSSEEVDTNNLSKIQKISVDSPVGKALLGKKKGNVIQVNAPAGNIKYKILAVKYE